MGLSAILPAQPQGLPLLEVADAGERSFSQFAPGSDIAQDIARYRIYQNVELIEETTDVTRYFEERDDLVSFLSGAASFESALLDADIPVRQIEEGVNVPMYNTNIPVRLRGVQRQHGRQYAAHPVCAGARGGSHHGRHAPRTRSTGADWHTGGYRHY